MIWWPFSKTKTILCPDGRPAIVYKHVDDAIPLELRNNSMRGNASLNVPELVSGEVAAQYHSVISGILFAINERNSSQVLDFRNAYLAYMADPCGKRDLLERAHNKIMDERNRLATLELRARTLIELVQGSPERADLILPHATSIMTDLNLPAPAAAVEAIQKARSEAQDMIAGPDGE